MSLESELIAIQETAANECVRALEALKDAPDREYAHREGDLLLCECFRQMGYDNVADAFQEVSAKWHYA